MSWVKIDDQFIFHPKVRAIGPSGLCLQVAGLCYSASQLTNGFISDAMLPVVLALAHVGDGSRILAKMVQEGVWEKVDGGYQIHDYLDYNPSREHELAKRRARAEAGRLGGEAKGKQNPSKAEAKGKQNPAPSPSPSPGPGPVPEPVLSPTEIPGCFASFDTQTEKSLEEPPNGPEEAPPAPVIPDTVLGKFARDLHCELHDPLPAQELYVRLRGIQRGAKLSLEDYLPMVYEARKQAKGRVWSPETRANKGPPGAPNRAPDFLGILQDLCRAKARDGP